MYFIVALLDKWSSILDGGQLLGLSALNTKYRMPVGFSLAYYLIGAVLLDFNAAKLHTMTAKGQNMLIGDVRSIPEAVKREVKARRSLYWTMLGRYLLLHVWSLALASCLLWIFDSTRESTILFISYVAAYTGKFHPPTHRKQNSWILILIQGLLWYQVRSLHRRKTMALTILTVYQDLCRATKLQTFACRCHNWSPLGTNPQSLFPGFHVLRHGNSGYCYLDCSATLAILRTNQDEIHTQASRSF